MSDLPANPDIVVSFQLQYHPQYHLLLDTDIVFCRNRFPDDTMLLDLSHYIIENRSVPLNSKDVTTLAGADRTHYDGTLVNIATEKITNWLVNCRTRKWRPVRGVLCFSWSVVAVICCDFHHSLNASHLNSPSQSSVRSTYADQ